MGGIGIGHRGRMRSVSLCWCVLRSHILVTLLHKKKCFTLLLPAASSSDNVSNMLSSSFDVVAKCPNDSHRCYTILPALPPRPLLTSKCSQSRSLFVALADRANRSGGCLVGLVLVIEPRAIGLCSRVADLRDFTCHRLSGEE